MNMHDQYFGLILFLVSCLFFMLTRTSFYHEKIRRYYNGGESLPPLKSIPSGTLLVFVVLDIVIAGSGAVVVVTLCDTGVALAVAAPPLLERFSAWVRPIFTFWGF